MAELLELCLFLRKSRVHLVRFIRLLVVLYLILLHGVLILCALRLQRPQALVCFPLNIGLLRLSGFKRLFEFLLCLILVPLVRIYDDLGLLKLHMKSLDLCLEGFPRSGHLLI